MYCIWIGPHSSLSHHHTDNIWAMEQYRDMGGDRDRFIIILVSPSYRRCIALSCHRTIASSSSHHRHSTIMSSLHPELEGVIVY